MKQLKVLAPFGPRIARLKFPQLIIKNINLEVERIIKQKETISFFLYLNNENRIFKISLYYE